MSEQTVLEVAKHFGFTDIGTGGGCTALHQYIGIEGVPPGYYIEDRPYILITGDPDQGNDASVPEGLDEKCYACLYRHRSASDNEHGYGWEQWHVLSDGKRNLLDTLNFIERAIAGAAQFEELMRDSPVAANMSNWWSYHLAMSSEEGEFFDIDRMDTQLPFPDEAFQYWLDGAMDYAIGRNRSTVGETDIVLDMEVAIVAVQLAIGLGPYPDGPIAKKPKPGDDLGTDLLNKLYQDFSRDAWALSDMIGRYPGEAEGCAEDYPFSRSFDEEVEHIRKWVETARRRLYEQD